MSGAVYGNAGGSLNDANWLQPKDKGAARVGASGEQRTARLLDAYAVPGGVTVLHDLRVPSSKYKANIDHVVVSGNRVFVIDSKVWKPARYWTLGGKTRRGLERFTPAEKQTMVVTQQALVAMFSSAGLDVIVEEPILFVWSSSKRSKLSTRFLKVPGARVISDDRIEKACERNFGTRLLGGGKPADQAVVNQLRTLLISPQGHVNRPGGNIVDL